jgi:hypothetical protein
MDADAAKSSGVGAAETGAEPIVSYADLRRIKSF